MKKLTTLALGLGLALGSVAFAQDSTMAPSDSTKTTKKAKKAKKTKKPATDASSTDKKM